MMKDIKMNFASDPSNEETNWECNYCCRIQSARHMQVCPYFDDLREGKNFSPISSRLAGIIADPDTVNAAPVQPHGTRVKNTN